MSDKLIEENINLVYFTIKKMGLTDEDGHYFSVGMIGLIKAAKTFDPSKGFKFSTLGCMCIKNQILQELRIEDKHRNVVASLQEPIESKNGGMILGDIIPCDYDLEDMAIHNEKIHLVNKALSMIDPNLKKFIYYYYIKELPQKEIAEIMGCKQATVSRRVAKAIRELKKCINNEKTSKIFAYQ